MRQCEQTFARFGWILRCVLFVDNEDLIQNKDVCRSFAGKKFRCRLSFTPTRKPWALCTQCQRRLQLVRGLMDCSLVTLVVALGFGHNILGRWRGPTNSTFVILWMHDQWWGYHEVVGRLKYAKEYELFAFTGGGDAKTLAMSAHPKEPQLLNIHI